MSQLQENKMGVMPVKRLVLSMSLPMMISMLVQALYNVVDSYFVAKVSENALAAVGLAFPFQNLMIAVSVGTGVGVNALLSRSLGAKDYETANRTAENGVFLAVISTLIFSAVGVLLAEPFFLAQNSDPDIVGKGVAYLRICAGFSFGLFLEIMFERLLQSTGRTFYTMITQSVGAISTSTAVAVFNVYFKLQSFVFMPVFGLNNGMVPIVSYNFGARKRKRLTEAVWFSAALAVGIMMVGLAVIQLFVAPILGLFEASQDMLDIGVPALRIISLCFAFAGFNIVCSSTFQALGNGVLSMIMSIVRQLVVLLPAAYLLSLTGRVTAVWWAFPIAEVASLALCLFFLRHTFRNVILPLGDEKEA